MIGVMENNPANEREEITYVCICACAAFYLGPGSQWLALSGGMTFSFCILKGYSGCWLAEAETGLDGGFCGNSS